MASSVMNVPKAVRNFYGKCLFDRIIIYIFLSEFSVKLIFELILGQWSFIQSQNKQWVFYGLLAIDYVISISRVSKIKVSINFISLFSVLIVIMIFHGLLVGLAEGNRPFEIFNDTVPLLMIALNILRMQSTSEKSNDPDVTYIFKVCLFLAICTCFLGIMGQLLGRLAEPSMGNGIIFLTLVLTMIFKSRSLSLPQLLATLAIIALAIGDLNRTSMLFVIIVSIIYVSHIILKNPFKGFSMVAAFVFVILVTALAVPEGSKTYRRIAGLGSVSLADRTGSIGERQAEQDAVQSKLNRLGSESQLLGLGFGGLYEVQFTHAYLRNYGHAHYSWVWFNLRFGKAGYFYLFAVVVVFLLNAYRSFKLNTEQGHFVGLMCLFCLLYLFTYVNGILTLSGLPFMYLRYATVGAKWSLKNKSAPCS